MCYTAQQSMTRRFLLLLALCLTLTDCAPPPASYAYSPMVTQRRSTLKDNLLKLLPAAEQAEQPAAAEAQWIADTAYKAAAGISRVNDSRFPGWAGNALINARLQDRGLCWHYQHDMFRELRRRPLHYFRVGCCVRDLAEASEHNCVYIAAKNDPWPKAWVLDAWMWNGRLKVDDARELSPKRWQDLPNICRTQQLYYPEGHQFPIEHWSILRDVNGEYMGYWMDETKQSSQYRRMTENISRGQAEHPGSLMNY